MNNDSNKKKVLMKSAVAFSFALAMFGANAGADVSAEEAMTTGKAGFNSTFDENEEDDDVQQGDEADNGDDTKGITTNMEESSAEAVSSVSSMLGAANGYNVFVKGDYSVNGADISSNGQLGNLAAGGNVSVPGDYTAGKVVVGGEVNGSFHNGMSDEKIDFDEAFKQLESASKSMADLEANGSVVANRYWGQISFNGSDPELNVFTITVDEYNAMREAYPDTLSFDFNVPAGSHCIVNILGGGSVDLAVNSGATYAKETITNSSVGNKNIIFNVPDAESVTIKDNMGALMAVNADVTTHASSSGNPHFEGSLICKNYNGSNEFGSSHYDEGGVVNKVTPPPAPDTEDPEPDSDPSPETPDPEPDPDPDPSPETPDPEPDPDPDPSPETPAPEPVSDPHLR
ncbi:MAG: choice-of-anchor A family protein, partial [Oscillospiraceae bacterium]|nr:choice-of-anchor A family protein [Oscillospiraceae bacterium]